MDDKPILLIDDNPDEIRLMEEAYKDTQFRYPIIKFTDSVQAFTYITENAAQIFMIVCDVNMPMMSGIDILEKVFNNRELRMKAIPFIFFSNSKEFKDVEKAFELSAQGYFQKPNTIVEMTLFLRFMINYWSISERPKGK